jgi:hypothetical protein
VNGENVRVDCGDERAKGVKDKTGPTTAVTTRFVAFRLSPRLRTTTQFYPSMYHKRHERMNHKRLFIVRLS